MTPDTRLVPVEAVQRLILAADSYGVRYLDSDYMAPEAEELQAATEAMKDILAAAPSERREPTREEIARVIDTLAFGITNDPPTDERRRNQRLSALYKADQILALFRGEG